MHAPAANLPILQLLLLNLLLSQHAGLLQQPLHDGRLLRKVLLQIRDGMSLELLLIQRTAAAGTVILVITAQLLEDHRAILVLDWRCFLRLLLPTSAGLAPCWHPVTAVSRQDAEDACCSGAEAPQHGLQCAQAGIRAGGASAACKNVTLAVVTSALQV